MGSPTSAFVRDELDQQPAVPWLREKPSLSSPQIITTQYDPQVLGCWFFLQRGPHWSRLSPSSWAKQQPVAVPCPPRLTVAEGLVWDGWDDGVSPSGWGRDGVFMTDGVGEVWWNDFVTGISHTWLPYTVSKERAFQFCEPCSLQKHYVLASWVFLEYLLSVCMHWCVDEAGDLMLRCFNILLSPQATGTLPRPVSILGL